MTVTLTLLDNDVALATVLPRYYNWDWHNRYCGRLAATLSETHDDLEIISCGTGAEVLRLKRARTQVDSIDIGDGLRSVTIMFIGEPTGSDPIVQFATQAVS